jgi:hypothetical protein
MEKKENEKLGFSYILGIGFILFIGLAAIILGCFLISSILVEISFNDELAHNEYYEVYKWGYFDGCHGIDPDLLIRTELKPAYNDGYKDGEKWLLKENQPGGE